MWQPLRTEQNRWWLYVSSTNHKQAFKFHLSLNMIEYKKKDYLEVLSCYGNISGGLSANIPQLKRRIQHGTQRMVDSALCSLLGLILPAVMSVEDNKVGVNLWPWHLSWVLTPPPPLSRGGAVAAWRSYFSYNVLTVSEWVVVPSRRNSKCYIYRY